MTGTRRWQLPGQVTAGQATALGFIPQQEATGGGGGFQAEEGLLLFALGEGHCGHSAQWSNGHQASDQKRAASRGPGLSAGDQWESGQGGL